LLNDQSGSVLGASTVFSWAGCHTLWVHRISRHGATKVTPFELVYGQEAVLPVEVNLGAYRLAKQKDPNVDT
jgi:hypothetical protein